MLIKRRQPEKITPQREFLRFPDQKTIVACNRLLQMGLNYRKNFDLENAWCYRRGNSVYGFLRSVWDGWAVGAL